MLLSCTSSGGSGAVPSPSPGFALESIIVADGAPPSPTPTPSVTPKVTPTATPKPTAMPTTIPAAGATISFNAQGTFVKGKKTTELLDITTSPSTAWTSSDPTVLDPNGNGNYTALKTGCACVLASNSNVSSQFTLIGVVTPFSSCPACTPVTVSPGSSNNEKVLQAATDATAAEPIRSAGVLMWTFDAGAELAGQIAVGADNSAYFITRDGVLHGLDSSGKEILHRRAGGNSPVVTATGSVIAKSSATELAAFGIDGATLWHVEIGAGGGPLAASESAIYASAGNDLVAISDAGLLKWRVNAGAISTAAPTTDGVAAAVTGGSITSVAADGGLLWTFTPAGGFSGGLSFADDVVYAGSASGRIYAIDERNGKALWTVTSPQAVVAGPAIGPSGTIFFGSDAVHGVAPSGQLRWTQTALKPAPGGISAGGVDGVFDAGADNLAAMLASDGNFIWTSRSFGAIAASAVAPNGTLYVGSSVGRIFAVR